MRRKTNLKKINGETIRQVTGLVFISMGALAIILPVALLSESIQSAYFVGAVVGSAVTTLVMSLLEYLGGENEKKE